jgi:HlyD family secretion protein
MLIYKLMIKKILMKKIKYLCSIILAIVFIYFIVREDHPLITDKLSYEVVIKGNFTVSELLLGKIKAKDMRVISSNTGGIVKEINIKEGDIVHKDSVLIRLSNVSLSKDKDRLIMDLESSQRDLRTLKIENEMELINLEQEKMIINNNLKLLNSKNKAEKKLNNIGIFSNSKMEKSDIELSNEKEKLISFKKLMKIKVKLRSEKMKNLEDKISYLIVELKRKEMEIKKLDLFVDEKSRISKIEVRKGSRTNNGDIIAEYYKFNDYVAKMNISEHEYNKIPKMANVILETVYGKMEGKISEAEPIMRKGSVEIEIIITGKILDKIRHSTVVQGEIIIDERNAMFIEKGSMFASNSEGYLFVQSRKENDEEKFEKRLVKFGDRSRNKMEILSGLVEGDKVITSNMDNYFDYDQVEVENSDK